MRTGSPGAPPAAPAARLRGDREKRSKLSAICQDPFLKIVCEGGREGGFGSGRSVWRRFGEERRDFGKREVRREILEAGVREDGQEFFVFWVVEEGAGRRFCEREAGVEAFRPGGRDLEAGGEGKKMMQV